METGLYYLQTRYYDPEIGRFISPDSTKYLEPIEINGLNLYTYCYNNPVMLTDPSGTIADLGLQLMSSLIGYLGMCIFSIWDKDVRADMNAIGWNPFNTDEMKVLASKKVSFYKGVPVYRMDYERSGPFGAIFLSRGYTDSNGIFYVENNPDTVRHEWGHTVQQFILGPIPYGLYIGIPSWREWSTRPYYARPWEITADIFGGVSPQSTSDKRKPRTSNNSARGLAYLATAYIFGPFVYLFLFGEY